ncbi:MAG: sulfate transporter CysZ [Gammaproteobacteria bacterium]|jgi:CysZ protein|nr:sulfate transporter CysZ [Gammaproteobacteria bacterium]|tara:strand:+ start:314 stop:1057 length:744 start_codon:yes stop_codon:yes gene_type:complete
MNGIDCFIEGFKLVRKPGLRRYIIVPTVINIFVLVLLITVSVSQFDYWVDGLMGILPEWMSFLSWLIKLLAVLIVAFLLFYLFTIIANIIASPFNALLSIKVEEHLVGKIPASTTSIWLIIPRAFAREISKLVYFLPRLAGLLLVSIVPLVNTAAPVLWLLFGAWMMAIQYTDYAADNNEIGFSDLRRGLGRSRLQTVLFGTPVYLLLAIPLANLILLPVAVAGGTVFWVNNLRGKILKPVPGESCP